MTEPKFPPNAKALKAIYELLERSGDVSFVDLYLTVGGDPTRADERDRRNRWHAQSCVSAYIRRLNKRLEPAGKKVVPGRIRRTYVLTTLQT